MEDETKKEIVGNLIAMLLSGCLPVMVIFITNTSRVDAIEKVRGLLSQDEIAWTVAGIFLVLWGIARLYFTISFNDYFKSIYKVVVDVFRGIYLMAAGVLLMLTIVLFWFDEIDANKIAILLLALLFAWFSFWMAIIIRRIS